MQRFILILAVIIVTIIFALQGFQATYHLPEVIGEEESVSEDPQGPEQAITDIYFNVSIMGVQDATPQRLEDDFGIDPSIYTSLYGKYTDGRFGIADVIIMRPKAGKEDEVREALQTIKLSRMSLFQNYDIYNSYSIAENGIIYQRGDYTILLMIDNDEAVQEIIDSYIPN